MTTSTIPNDNSPTWLQLPGRDQVAFRGATLQYGADRIIQQYCGLDDPPQQLTARWKHGWHPQYMQVDPRFIATETIKNPSSTHLLVARKDEAIYLRKHGYAQARAIGLPIAYLKPQTYERKSGSLLVMPAHSQMGQKRASATNEYVDQILDLRGKFDEIVICLSPTCTSAGNWIDDFRATGLPIVFGADSRDRNSLERIAAMMSQFEFVTTNIFGSAIAYGAAFGARVSLYGKYCEISLKECEETSFFQQCPGLAQVINPLRNEERVRQELPELFCSPEAAIEQTHWGQEQIGATCRIPPEELCKYVPSLTEEANENSQSLITKSRLARWTLPPGVADKMRHVKNSVSPPLQSPKSPLEIEHERLRALPRNEAGKSTIDGRVFHFTDGRSFIWEHTQIFQNRCYDFPCIYEDPRIIDCGANIGIGVRYWLRKFPKARLTAFEPDSDLFATLGKNVAETESKNVTLHNAAVWKEDTTLEFCSTGVETGHLTTTQSPQEGTMTKVKAVRLGQFLNEPVEFLKIDVEGAETDVIVDSADQLVNVKRIWLEYHSFLDQPQRLAEILDVLQQKGFRYHIVTESVSEQPLQRVDASYGMDQRLNIWAYQGERFPRTIER